MPGFIELVDVGYAFPGGRRLFGGVSFRVAERERVALVGANGVGKTTLLRLVAEDDGEHEGLIRVIGRRARMPQLVHQPGSQVTVRELLLGQAPVELLKAGSSLLAAERRLSAEPTESAGAAFAEAVHQWGELGGYDLEISWNAASVAAVRAPIAEAGARAAATLSGGELKRLLLEALFRSDADVLLLDEPDNFLDVTGKEWLEAELLRSRKTILYISHDREFLANTTTQVVTLEAIGSWTHPASFVTYDEARQKRLRNLEEDHHRRPTFRLTRRSPCGSGEAGPAPSRCASRVSGFRVLSSPSATRSSSVSAWPSRVATGPERVISCGSWPVRPWSTRATICWGPESRLATSRRSTTRPPFQAERRCTSCSDGGSTGPGRWGRSAVTSSIRPLMCPRETVRGPAGAIADPPPRGGRVDHARPG